MKVKVAQNTYQMDKKEYEGLLKIASEQVPFGIYAIERNGYAELRNDRCNSISQLKKWIHQWKSQGFKVHYNGK